MKRVDVRTAYAIAHHAALPSAHHVKFTDAEAALALYGYGGICWSTLFESLDGFEQEVSGGGTITIDFQAVGIRSGSTAGQYANLGKQLIYPVSTPTWDKKRRIITAVDFSQDQDNLEHWFVTGFGGEWGVTRRHIGIKDISGTLYGTVGNGTNESVLDIGPAFIEINHIMTLEAVFTPATECRFFVDGVDKGVITTNLPSGVTDEAQYPIFIQAKTLEDVQKSIYLTEWRFLQEP